MTEEKAGEQKAGTDEGTQRRLDDIQSGKIVAFYEVCANAFVNSAMELDKSLLTLAAGAIGFSLALISPVKESELLLFLYFSAIFLFLITIFSTLGALKANTYHIEGIVKTGAATNTGTLMKNLDRLAIWSFAVGVLLMTIVGACSVVEQRRSAKDMNDDADKLQRIERSLNRVESLAESLHLLNRLNTAPTPSLTPPATTPSSVTPVPGTPGSLVPRMPSDK